MSENLYDECPLWEPYGNWLLLNIGFRKRGYGKLMDHLHRTIFTWTIERDENRAEDGMKYRTEFWSSLGGNAPENLKNSLLNKPCSVLEMLIGLAIRVENEYIGDPENPHPEVFFWEMCCNLGLDEFKNKGFSAKKCGNCDKKLLTWLKRNHNSDGFGSIFPIKNTERDLKNVEIWSQCMEYLSKNYVF